jgi:hypothetical protein
MRSKTILAAVVAGALGVPLASLADDSPSSRTPSAGASVDNSTSVQGAVGSSDRSASAYGQDRGDRQAQNEDRDHDRGEHRGRDKNKNKDKSASSQYPSNSQYSQNTPSQSSQYPQSSSSQGSGQYSQNSPSQYGSNSGNTNQRYSSNSSY